MGVVPPRPFIQASTRRRAVLEARLELAAQLWRVLMLVHLHSVLTAASSSSSSVSALSATVQCIWLG
jgi:hypothetical protein